MSAVASPADLAVSAGLTYINCFGRRVPNDVVAVEVSAIKAADGSTVPMSHRNRIASLVIPPAWRDVWICCDLRATLQAVGRDELGRKQYIYHARWQK